MTRAEKEALAKWLGEIADKLEGAEADTEQRALACVERDRSMGRSEPERARYPYQVGALCFITSDAAESIRAAIRTHLAPRKRSK